MAEQFGMYDLWAAAMTLRHSPQAGQVLGLSGVATHGQGREARACRLRTLGDGVGQGGMEAAREGVRKKKKGLSRLA